MAMRRSPQCQTEWTHGGLRRTPLHIRASRRDSRVCRSGAKSWYAAEKAHLTCLRVLLTIGMGGVDAQTG